MKRILVVRNDKIGDFMLAWPSFAMLKRSMECHVTALVPAYTAPLARLCPWIDEIILDPGARADKEQQRALLARIKAILRRKNLVNDTPPQLMQFGSLEIDRDARRVSVKGQECELTSYQYDLLVALAERAGRVLTRDQIMEAVRGRELEAFDRSIDVHMGRIRAAIEADPKAPQRILTVRGVGYVFARQQD